MSQLFCILDFCANWWILCTWSVIETKKKNSYKNVNIIDELRLPQSSLLLWHNWVIIETLKIPTKISNSSCASTHWNLKNLSKTNFFSPNSQLPESWQNFTLSNYNYLYLCLFPAWCWTWLFFSFKKIIPTLHLTW